MGRRRHLEGALLPLRDAGEPLELAAVGRDARVLADLAGQYSLRVFESLDRALAAEQWDVYFDANRPIGREERLASVINAGIDVYSEKPLALSLDSARRLQALVTSSKVNGFIVADKLFTPGFRALRHVLDSEVLGDVLDVRGDFGYFIDSGLDGKKPQRPSWNYQSTAGGSLFPDLYSHWNYMVEMIAPISSVASIARTHIPQRKNEAGGVFTADVPDTAHVIGCLANGATLSLSTSWVYRPAVPFSMRVSGRSAAAEVSPTHCVVHHANGDRTDAVSAYNVSSEDEFLLQWIQVLLGHRGEASTSLRFADAVQQAIVCDALERSAAIGATVSIAARGAA